MSIDSINLNITASRTKTDPNGTPCIRVAYNPFTEYGRVWSASAIRATESGIVSAQQQNGFLYFPVLEGEDYSEDQPINVIISLDFLSFCSTVLKFQQLVRMECVIFPEWIVLKRWIN